MSECRLKALRPVTGPDGDNPIRDAQIRELRVDGFYPPEIVRDAWAALGDGPLTESAFETWRHIPRATARSRCAAAWNACCNAGGSR